MVETAKRPAEVTMDNVPTLGQRVRQQRQTLGLTQGELARRARITQPRVSQIERDEVVGAVPARTLSDLADGLGVALTVLTGDAASAAADAPPDPVPAGLPPAGRPLIGRTTALAAVAAQLAAPDVRVLTLTGPGGVGKTHLALHAAQARADAGACVTIVPLASCAGAGQIVSAISRTLGLPKRDGRPSRERLLAALRPTPRLLLLDNVEQALPAAAAVATDLIAACPRLTLLVTSRAPLRIRGEHEFPVPPLALPDPAATPTAATVATAPAVALFVEQANAVLPRFAVTENNAAALAGICRRLDGLPLAIELAAARAKAFPPAQLLQRLDRPLDFLVDGPRDLPARQRTLRSALDWSERLLTPDQRALFRRLAVFTGGFTLAAAAAVAGGGEPAVADGVAALLDHSLLERAASVTGAPRFEMLETVREYARTQLVASGEFAVLARRHLAWGVALAERAERILFGDTAAAALATLDAERDNLRAALAWAFAHGEVERGARLASALTDYWYLRGPLGEGRDWLERALALLPEHGAAARTRMRVLAGISQLALPHGDWAAAEADAAASFDLARALHDHRGIARALVLRANLAYARGDFAQATALHREALALCRALGDRPWIVAELNNRALVAYARGDAAQAADCAEEALALARQIGDAWGAGLALRTLGDVALTHGATASGERRFAASLALAQQRGNRRAIANDLAAFANLAAARGDAARAIRLFGAASALFDALGIRTPPPLRPDWRSALRGARSQLVPARANTAWAAGRALTIEQAVTEALAGPAGPAASATPVLPHRRRAKAHVQKRGVKPRGA